VKKKTPASLAGVFHFSEQDVEQRAAELSVGYGVQPGAVADDRRFLDHISRDLMRCRLYGIVGKPDGLQPSCRGMDSGHDRHPDAQAGRLKLLRQLPARSLIAAVRLYQWTLSPLIGRQCRFWPTCSQYFIEAVQKYGAVKGSWRGFRRICRCHPFHPGGIDPP